MDASKRTMSYNKFAYVYDELMSEAPYESWLKFTQDVIARYNISPKTIVDLGSGTGNIAIPLVNEGYQVVGVDISSDMLAIAGEKMLANNVAIQLIEQDMRELDLNRTVDMVVCYCDSLNYLSNIDDVKQTFINVNKHLESGGYFIFDMHSPYKLTDVYNNNTFAWNDEEVSVIWLPDVNEEKLEVEHELTFFVKDEDGRYDKFEEYHNQKAYSPDVICELLEATGFEVVDVFADYELEQVDETTERIFYVARK